MWTWISVAEAVLDFLRVLTIPHLEELSYAEMRSPQTCDHVPYQTLYWLYRNHTFNNIPMFYCAYTLINMNNSQIVKHMHFQIFRKEECVHTACYSEYT